MVKSKSALVFKVFYLLLAAHSAEPVDLDSTRSLQSAISLPTLTALTLTNPNKLFFNISSQSPNNSIQIITICLHENNSVHPWKSPLGEYCGVGEGASRGYIMVPHFADRTFDKITMITSDGIIVQSAGTFRADDYALTGDTWYAKLAYYAGKVIQAVRIGAPILTTLGGIHCGVTAILISEAYSRVILLSRLQLDLTENVWKGIYELLIDMYLPASLQKGREYIYSRSYLQENQVSQCKPDFMPLCKRAYEDRIWVGEFYPLLTLPACIIISLVLLPLASIVCSGPFASWWLSSIAKLQPIAFFLSWQSIFYFPLLLNLMTWTYPTTQVTIAKTVSYAILLLLLLLTFLALKGRIELIRVVGYKGQQLTYWYERRAARDAWSTYVGSWIIDKVQMLFSQSVMEEKLNDFCKVAIVVGLAQSSVIIFPYGFWYIQCILWGVIDLLILASLLLKKIYKNTYMQVRHVISTVCSLATIGSLASNHFWPGNAYYTIVVKIVTGLLIVIDILMILYEIFRCVTQWTDMPGKKQRPLPEKYPLLQYKNDKHEVVTSEQFDQPYDLSTAKDLPPFPETKIDQDTSSMAFIQPITETPAPKPQTIIQQISTPTPTPPPQPPAPATLPQIYQPNNFYIVMPDLYSHASSPSRPTPTQDAEYHSSPKITSKLRSLALMQQDQDRETFSSLSHSNPVHSRPLNSIQPVVGNTRRVVSGRRVIHDSSDEEKEWGQGGRRASKKYDRNYKDINDGEIDDEEISKSGQYDRRDRAFKEKKDDEQERGQRVDQILNKTPTEPNISIEKGIKHKKIADIENTDSNIPSKNTEIKHIESKPHKQVNDSRSLVHPRFSSKRKPSLPKENSQVKSTDDQEESFYPIHIDEPGLKDKNTKPIERKHNAEVNKTSKPTQIKKSVSPNINSKPNSINSRSTSKTPVPVKIPNNKNKVAPRKEPSEAVIPTNSQTPTSNRPISTEQPSTHEQNPPPTKPPFICPIMPNQDILEIPSKHPKSPEPSSPPKVQKSSLKPIHSPNKQSKLLTNRSKLSSPFKINK